MKPPTARGVLHRDTSVVAVDLGNTQRMMESLGADLSGRGPSPRRVSPQMWVMDAVFTGCWAHSISVNYNDEQWASLRHRTGS